MNLILHLPAPLEAKLREQAKAAGKPLEDVVLEALQEKLIPDEEGRLPRDKWHARFEAFLALLPRTDATFVDDSRESIYEGRGE